MILILLAIKYTIYVILIFTLLKLFENLTGDDNSYSRVFGKRGWANIKLVPIFVFAAVILYQVKILYFEKPDLLDIIIEQEDKRAWNRDKHFVRGEISDRNGIILAKTDFNNKTLRNYQYPEELAHLMGYFLPERRERTGLERIFNETLSGNMPSGSILLHPIRLAKNFNKLHTEGDDLKLTIDIILQKTAYDGLEGRKGAIAGIDTETGDVLFLVSSPGYDPQTMYEEDNWDRIREKEALLNRTLEGLYEPGSTFKVIVAAAAIENGKSGFKINCTREGFIPNGATRAVTDHGGEFHGMIGMAEAVKKSCNIYFSRLGVELGETLIKKYAEKFLFNESISINSSKKVLVHKNSFFPPVNDIDENALAWSSIGQYKLQITPIHMAIVASIIANDGVFTEPKIEINIGRGDTERIIARDTAVSLRKMMAEVVGDSNKDLFGPPTWEARKKFGTGWRAKVKGLPIAGKTGTAENPHGEPHAWFMGFGPVEKPKIAFAIVVENGGFGGEVSGPIAKKILQKAMDLGYFKEKDE